MSESTRKPWSEHRERGGGDGFDAVCGGCLVPKLLVALLITTSWLILCCAQASALLDRGHVFGSSFGSEGTGPGQFEEPTGVAVDEASQTVYVVDRKNERVEIFRTGSNGEYEYISQFKVHSPAAIAVDNSSSESDPSRGDVYVVGAEEAEVGLEEHDVVYEYSPTQGTILHKWKTFKVKEGESAEELELEDIYGVAVDKAGTLWVYWGEEGTIDAFAKVASTSKSGSRLVWEPSQRREPDVALSFGCSARPGFAVAPNAEFFYVGHERENGREECPGEFGDTPDPDVVAKIGGPVGAPAIVTAELDREGTNGAAVETSSGDVYLDNETSITAFNDAGLLIQRFGSENLRSGSGIATDATNGDLYIAASHEDKVDVFVAESAPGAPVVDSVSSRDVNPSSAELLAQIDPRGETTEYFFEYGTVNCEQSPGSCAKTAPAKIEAGFGDRSVSASVSSLQPASAYFYRLLATDASGGPIEGVASPNTFTTLPSPSVLPDDRAWEMVSPPEKHGASIEGISSSFKGGITQASADGGALTWLANSPVTSAPEGNRSFELTQLMSVRGDQGWETQSLETPHHNGSGLLSPSPAEYHFFSPDLSLALVEPTEPTRQVGGVSEQPPLSPEASEKTMYVRDNPPLKPTEAAEEALFAQARSEDDLAYLSPGYLPLVTAANDTARTQFGGALEFVGATPQLNHDVFESKVGLTSQAPSAGGLYEWSAGEPLQLVSVLPGSGEPSGEAILGDGEGQNSTGGLDARNAISNDGTRIFWTEGKEHLYLRDTETKETIAINAAQGHGATEPGEGKHEVPEPEAEQQEVHFQTASTDGSKVFFTDSARLTEDSTLEPVGEEGPADLYEFETTSHPGEPLRGRLTDLTPGSTTGNADVLNLIPGASSNGSIVYFVANGALTPGAITGDCPRYTQQTEPPPGTKCNLYMSMPDPEHPDSHETRLIAALSSEDAADWGAGFTSKLLPSQGNLSAMTSRVSPNGHYLAFMSDRSLTGYNNRNAGEAQAPDEEVYLYDATANRLICASCNPNEQDGSWKRPEGVFDTKEAGEGVGLLVDRPEIWQNRWLGASVPGWTFDITNVAPSALYQSRYLSNDGRLFFDSPDALVPQATNGKEDVYEYEPDGIGTCQRTGGCTGLISSGTSDRESVFLDASENGDDVFFLTAAKLAPQDTDEAYDIYDAHECSEQSPCHSSPGTSQHGCETASTCNTAPPSPPPSVTPAQTETVSGAGNAPSALLAAKTPTKAKAPLTRAQKLASALKACKRIKSRRKRRGCETQARRRYGAKPHARHKKNASRVSSRRAQRGRVHP